jgi:hypothetical protein
MPSKYKSGITDEHLQTLGKWIGEEYAESPIEVHVGNSLASLEQESELARRMCRLAARRYAKPRPLYFLPVQSKISNARALWLDGFDAVTVTAPLIREIQAYAACAAEMARGSALHPKTGQRSSFACVGVELLQDPAAAEVLTGILTQGMFAFLIGHEIGHLAAGHIGVIQAYRHPGKNSASAGELGATSDAAGEPDIGDPTVAMHLNAIEIDADVQACDFLLRHWQWVRDNARDSLEDPDQDKRLAADIVTNLLNDKRSRFFISMVCMTSMIALLGFGEFDPERLLRKSHPLSAMRVITAMDTLASLYEFDSVSRQMLYRNEATEGICFVHAVLGRILVRAGKSDATNKVAQHLISLKPAEQLPFLLQQTGIQGAIEALEKIALHTQDLAAAFNSTHRLRVAHRRFANDDIVRWSLSREQASVLFGKS